MTRRALLVAALCACHATPRRASPLVLVVAPGSPLGSLEAARDEIRRLRRDHGLPAGGATVVVRGGVYERDRPFVLSAEDSGTPAAPIVYRAAAGETVRIVGGRRLPSLAPLTDPAVLARLTPAAREAVRVADLHALGISDFGNAGGGGLEMFANHQPLHLARWPDQGFVHIADVPSAEPVDVRGVVGDRSGRFTYEGERPTRWLDEPDVWLHGFWFWDWADDRERVAAIDPQHHEITLAPPLHHYGYRKGQWYYAYNLLTELDQLGEWYLDRTRGLLYVWPPPGELVVSVAEQLVVLDHASYVELRGFTFEAARGTAITVTEGAHDRIEGCTITDVGGWGVRVTGGSDDAVLESEISQAGQGGVALEGGDRATLTAANHRVEGCDLHDLGRWDRTRQPAISISGVGQRVAHNRIHDLPHTAILFAGNDHVIERNDIHNVCTEANDAGAIYAGRDWTMRGTVIRENVLRDITGFEHKGCNGILLDDMFSGTTIEHNVFYRVSRGVLVGGGRDNTIAHNVFLECEVDVLVDARGLGWAAYSLPGMQASLRAMPYTGALWTARYPNLAAIAREEPAAPRGNTIVANLVGGDPGFVDPRAGDFRLRPDAAARRIGLPADLDYTSSRTTSPTNRAFDTR